MRSHPQLKPLADACLKAVSSLTDVIGPAVWKKYVAALAQVGGRSRGGVASAPGQTAAPEPAFAGRKGPCRQAALAQVGAPGWGGAGPEAVSAGRMGLCSRPFMPCTPQSPKQPCLYIEDSLACMAVQSSINPAPRSALSEGPTLAPTPTHSPLLNQSMWAVLLTARAAFLLLSSSQRSRTEWEVLKLP